MALFAPQCRKGYDNTHHNPEPLNQIGALEVLDSIHLYDFLAICYIYIETIQKNRYFLNE